MTKNRSQENTKIVLFAYQKRKSGKILKLIYLEINSIIKEEIIMIKNKPQETSKSDSLNKNKIKNITKLLLTIK